MHFVVHTLNSIPPLPLICQVDVPSATVTTLAGATGISGTADGAGSNARFNTPYGVAMDAAGTFAVAADQHNNFLRTIILSSGVVTSLAGKAGISGFGESNAPQSSPSHPPTPLCARTFSLHLPSLSSADGIGTFASFQRPSGISMNAAGTIVVVADWQNSLIRSCNIATGATQTIAGLAGTTGVADGVGSIARFNKPVSVGIDALASVAIVVSGVLVVLIVVHYRDPHARIRLTPLVIPCV